MNFSEVLNLILDSCPFLRNNDYDGIIVKKLAATNTISDTGASHQSHIAFTGRQKDFFPFLNADGYFNVGYESKDDDLKKYFTLQIPVTIYKENTDSLTNEKLNSISYTSDKKTVKASVLRSRRNNADDQIELSIKSLDDEEFIEFRKLLRVNDFFVLLKHRNELKYDLVGIRGSDKNAEELSKCTDFYKIGTQTPVSIENFGDEIPSTKIIPYPHNRIIFGAPGTGKSNRLKNDCDVCFTSNVDIKELLINEIKNRPQNKDKEPWFNHIGIKYASYIYKRCEEETEGNLQLQWGVAQNELWKMKTAARATIDYNHAVLSDELKCDLRYERVTFHPNYSYAQFVGTYKPVQDNNDDKQIKYEYVPGAFMRIYVSAKKNLSQNFLLLIEEINRANVAAVFGDVFQLLDRKSDGSSEYPVAASEDIKKYLAKNGIQEDEISIPSNMYIWATMNSADQGVFPIDTAFKRRWEFEYIGIDENEKEVENFYIPINANKKVKWNELRKRINDKLVELGINEDKLLGPFFLNKTILENAMNKDSNFIKLFESKVLMYLFEDAAKMKVRQLFNLQDNKYIYSEICKKFEKDGLAVFNFEGDSKVIIEDIESVSQPANGALF